MDNEHFFNKGLESLGKKLTPFLVTIIMTYSIYYVAFFYIPYQWRRWKLYKLNPGNITYNLEQCPICLDKMTTPVRTRCGHAFCLECLVKHIKVSKTCICPICRNHFDYLECLHNCSLGKSDMKLKKIFERRYPIKIKT